MTEPRNLAVLLGGPRHANGREIYVGPVTRRINVPDAPSLPGVIVMPKRTWLDRLLRRPQPPPPMPDLTFKIFTYERYGTRHDGAIIYLCRKGRIG